MKKKYTKFFRSVITAMFSALLIVLIRLVSSKEGNKPTVGEFILDFGAVLGCSYLTSLVISAANGKAMSGKINA